MKHGYDVRARAAELFEKGYSHTAAAKQLGLSSDTVKVWLYTYRALGKEALFVSSYRSYSYEVKVKAASLVVDEHLTTAEVMKIFEIKSRTQINNWCRLYRKGGAEALLPKRKGRPKKKAHSFATHEEELEARVQELELELEIQKRINALADEIGRR